ncbi:RNA polymerase II transcription factor B subunit 3 [Porphyridium purpureum]|uniref:RNA polymerase II transcription factor B subunit 3 n=1 Tax=Porphyridium purpureum TaxID=35688 RepID=A0A5J4Z4K1_PORPP|nr:RNA polymerase II transcription factor B subunit 3 [Porphyridium purpureum]|eukprot:POR5224..scf295_1
MKFGGAGKAYRGRGGGAGQKGRSGFGHGSGSGGSFRQYGQAPSSHAARKPVARAARQEFGGAQDDDMQLLSRYTTWRKRVLKEFNLRLEDFGGDERKYNDYLEMVEDLIQKLAHGVDPEETEEALAKNRADNAERIRINQIRKAEEDRAAAEKLAVEEREWRQQLEKLRRADAEMEREHRLERELRRVEQIERVQGKQGSMRAKIEAMRGGGAHGVEDPQPTALAPSMMATNPVLGFILPGAVVDARVPDKNEKDPNLARKAAGWDPELVEQRAILEFMQSLAL